jgi:hypothetical protein
MEDTLELPVVEEKPLPQKLTFSLALLLTPLPATEQTRLAKKITSQKTSLAAARRIIYRETRHHEEVTKRSPTDLLASLISLCDSTEDKFGIFVDLLPPDFAAMIDLKNELGKRVIAEKLEDLAENIGGIAESIRQRITRPAGHNGERHYSNR